MKRRTAREMAFKLIFELGFYSDITQCVAGEIYNLALLYRSEEILSSEYAKGCLLGVAENLERIDAVIKKHLKGWNFSRLSYVSLSLLRLSTYEMCYAGIAVTVSIDEAVELAKIYDTDKAPGYINGVLNSIATDMKLKNSEVEE